MYFLRLVVKNALRHKLRTTLTVVGIVVAISAFGLLRTVIDAWYAGANASSSARLVGRKLAVQYGWKIGDQIPLRGTIFPGTWTFNLRGIYDGATKTTAESQMFFHWAYLNESIKKRFPRRGDQIGVLIEQLKDPDQA